MEFASKPLPLSAVATAKAAAQAIRLQMYQTPPDGEIQLHDVEQFALERLKVLKSVEEVGQEFARGSRDYTERLTKRLEKLASAGGASGTDSGRFASSCLSMATRRHGHQEDVRLDVVSHFLLRLAYCRSEELRRWFLSQEVDLFRFRFAATRPAHVQQFLRDNAIRFEPVPAEERTALAEQLLACAESYASAPAPTGAAPPPAAEQLFYKVDFTEALELVRARRCLLRAGQAYVAASELQTLVTARFRAHLSAQLALSARTLPYLQEEARLLPMLSSLTRRYLGEDHFGAGSRAAAGALGVVRAEEVDTLARRAAYPLCMREMHQALRRDAHLKHWGRQQYGLFLKVLGLPLEESVKFWRGAFAKHTPADKWDRAYGYNVRYLYGREGRRVDMSAYSCMSLITGPAPAAGECHGCPYRNLESGLLAQKLAQLPGLETPAAREPVLAKARAGHFQLACKEVFRASHGLDEQYDMVVNHPNQYSAEALKLGKAGSGAGEPRPAKEVRRVSVPATLSTPSSSQAAWDDDDDDELMRSVEVAEHASIAS